MLRPRPIDATLTVTRAAQVLGVHPNTVRAWSDAGRLRYYRINPRGDRRYRMGDLQRFIAGSLAPAVASEERADEGRPAGRSRAALDAERASGAVATRASHGTVLVPADDPSLGVRLASRLGDITANAMREALSDPARPLATAVRAIH